MEEILEEQTIFNEDTLEEMLDDDVVVENVEEVL